MAGFSVEVWHDLKGGELKNQLSEIFSRYGNMSNGRLFFYYFGHGYTLGSENDDVGPRTFLVPVDASNPVDDGEGFLSTGLQISQLAEYARQATTKHVFFALEACRAGAVIAMLAGPAAIAPKAYLLSSELQRPVRQFLTAGSPDQDVPARGEFTNVLIEGLSSADRNGDGYVTGSELMEYVALIVPQRAPGQHPEKGNVRQLGGDLVFGPVSPNVLPPIQTSSTVTPAEFGLCRHPDHGLEKWSNVVDWTADSGWRGGGSSPQSFCGAAKLQREAQYPDRTVTLVRSSEDHRAVYNPFKHDEYHYTCQFTDEWGPIYKEARSRACGRP